MKKSSRTGPNPIQNAPKSHARASFFRKIPEVADGCRHGRSAQFLHSYSSSLPGSRFNTQALWGLYEWIPAEPVSRVLHTLTNKRDEACTSSTWIDETNRWTNHSLPSTKSELLLNYCFTGNQSDNICGNFCSLLSTHGYIPWYMQHPNLTHQSMGVDYIEQRFSRVSMEEVPTYEVWVNWQFLFLNHSMGWSFYAPHQLQSSHDSDLDQPIKFVCFSLLWFVCTWLQISHTIVYGELQFYNIFLLNKK